MSLINNILNEPKWSMNNGYVKLINNGTIDRSNFEEFIKNSGYSGEFDYFDDNTVELSLSREYWRNNLFFYISKNEYFNSCARQNKLIEDFILLSEDEDDLIKQATAFILCRDILLKLSNHTLNENGLPKTVIIFALHDQKYKTYNVNISSLDFENLRGSSLDNIINNSISVKNSIFGDKTHKINNKIKSNILNFLDDNNKMNLITLANFLDV